MKKLLIALTALIFVFTLSGCDLLGGGGDDGPDLTALTITGVADIEVLVGAEVNLLAGITAGGNDDVDYSSYITVDSPTCTIAADGTLETTVPLNCIVTYTVLAFGVLKTAQASVTINPVPVTWDGGPELISWDFSNESDLDGWEIYVTDGGSLDISIEDGAMKMVTESSSLRYGTRLDFQGIPMEEDYDYRISFRMKSSLPDKAVHVNFGELIGGAPYFYPFKAEGFDIITVGTEWAEYEVIFTMSGQDAAANLNRGALVLEMGDNEGFLSGVDATLWIDDIKIEGGSGVDNAAPNLSGIQDVILDRGATFDPLEGVTANDLTDGDLTSAIVLTGDTVDTSVDGEYNLTYTVTDAAGNVATMDRVVTVIGLVIDANNSAVGDFFATNSTITGDASAAWFTTIVYGEPIFTAEIVDGQLILVSQKDGDKEYGTNYWDHIVRFTEMNFIKDIEYKVEFDAKTSVVGNTDNNIMFKVEAAGGFASETTLAVTDTFETYSHTFKFTADSTTAGSILWFVGGSEHTITIENVKIYISIDGASVDNAPIITGTEDAVVTTGDTEFDLLTGVEASDIEDGVLVPVVTVLGPNDETVFSTDIDGEWTITYTVTDSGSNEVVATRLVTVTAREWRPTDQVMNGNFEYGNWEVYGAWWESTAFTYAVNNEVLELSITDVGPANWSIQLVQQNINLVVGKTYRVSFDATSTVDRDIRVKLIHATELEQDVTVTVAGDTYMVDFVYDGTEDAVGRLSIEIGNVNSPAASDMTFDNVKVEEFDGTAVVADTDQIVNGDFANGFVYDEWAATGNAGTLEVKYNEGWYTYTDVGSNPWDSKLEYTGIELEAGETYRLSFKAKGDVARDFKIGFWDGSNPIGFDLLQLGTEFADYEVVFTWTLNNPANFEFQLGKASENFDGTLFVVDDLKIEKEFLPGDDVVEPKWTGYGMDVAVVGEVETISYTGIAAEWWNTNVQQSIVGFDGTQTSMSFTFTGTAGHDYVFKIEGGGQAVESEMTADGTEQTIVLDLSALTEAQRNGLNLLVFFVKTLAAEGSAVVTANFDTVEVAPDPVWTGYNMTVVEGDLGPNDVTITYDNVSDPWWNDNAQHSNIVFDGDKTAIEFTFTGTAGAPIVFKVEGWGGNVEGRMTADGTEQTYLLNLNALTKEQREKITLMVIFVESPGAAGTLALSYEAVTVELDPEWQGFSTTTVVENVDGSVDITYDVSTEWWWDFSAQHLNVSFDGTTFNAIEFTFTGVDTHLYKFKVEYTNGAKETGDGVVGDGTEQVVVLDLSTLTPEQLSSINKVVIFSSAQGQVGTVTVSYALITVAVDTSTLADMPNQDFTDADISGWGKEGSLTLSHDATNGHLVVSVTELGANPWDQNIGFPGQNLVAGNTYEVTYVIKTAFAAGRDVTFFVENVDNNYAKYFEETRTLTDVFQTFTFTFTPDANNDDTKLGIFFGNMTNAVIGDVIIDSITITETVPAS